MDNMRFYILISVNKTIKTANFPQFIWLDLCSIVCLNPVTHTWPLLCLGLKDDSAQPNVNEV